MTYLPGSINRQVTTVDVVNTAAETNLYSFSVPGGTLGTDGWLRLTLVGDYLQNSGGNRTITLRVKYGGTVLGILTSGNIGSAANRASVRVTLDLVAGNATNVQRALVSAVVGVTGTAGNPPASGAYQIAVDTVNNAAAIDSTTAQTLVVTAQHSAANANLSARALSVILERM